MAEDKLPTGPRVTVIMAVYNVGSFSVLELAVESILRQDMEGWELLICDDGSRDETLTWLLEWEKRDSRIRVLQNSRNLGAAGARNRCLREAKGAYIAVMDADDACSSGRLRLEVDFLDAHPQFAFVGLPGERFQRLPGDMDKPYWFCRFPQKEDFLMTLPFVHASLMFRGEAISKVGGYDETRRVERSEDYDMLLRMYAQGLCGANITEEVYYIREDEGAFRRRKYRYRLKEAAVKLRGFSRRGHMPQGRAVAVKPAIVGLIPARLLERLKGRYYGRKKERL